MFKNISGVLLTRAILSALVLFGSYLLTKDAYPYTALYLTCLAYATALTVVSRCGFSNIAINEARQDKNLSFVYWILLISILLSAVCIASIFDGQDKFALTCSIALMLNWGFSASLYLQKKRKYAQSLVINNLTSIFVYTFTLLNISPFYVTIISLGVSIIFTLLFAKRENYKQGVLWMRATFLHHKLRPFFAAILQNITANILLYDLEWLSLYSEASRNFLQKILNIGPLFAGTIFPLGAKLVEGRKISIALLFLSIILQLIFSTSLYFLIITTTLYYLNRLELFYENQYTYINFLNLLYLSLFIIMGYNFEVDLLKIILISFAVVSAFMLAAPSRMKT